MNFAFLKRKNDEIQATCVTVLVSTAGVSINNSEYYLEFVLALKFILLCENCRQLEFMHHGKLRLLPKMMENFGTK